VKCGGRFHCAGFAFGTITVGHVFYVPELPPARWKRAPRTGSKPFDRGLDGSAQFIVEGFVQKKDVADFQFKGLELAA